MAANLDAPPGDSPQRLGHSGRAMAVSLLLTASLDVGLTVLVFNLAKGRHASDQVAYVASATGPLTMMVVSWFRARVLGGASLVILAFLGLSAAAAFLGGPDSRLLIVKDSLVTGGFGLGCLVSMLFRRPLMYYFGARFTTDGTREGLRAWEGLWQYAAFRRSQYQITAIWGIGFVVEAALKILLASTMSFQAAYTITNLLPVAFLVVLATASIAVGRRAQSRRRT